MQFKDSVERLVMAAINWAAANKDPNMGKAMYRRELDEAEAALRAELAACQERERIAKDIIRRHQDELAEARAGASNYSRIASDWQKRYFVLHERIAALEGEWHPASDTETMALIQDMADALRQWIGWTHFTAVTVYPMDVREKAEKVLERFRVWADKPAPPEVRNV